MDETGEDNGPVVGNQVVPAPLGSERENVVEVPTPPRESRVQPFQSFPGIHCRFDPELVIKFRKFFYPVRITRLSLGADFNVRQRRWSLNWSWRDRIIGGRLDLDGTVVSLSKELRYDRSNVVNFRVGYDLHAQKRFFAVDLLPFQGFTARGNPPGFEFRSKINLDKRLRLDTTGTVTVPQATYGFSDYGFSFGGGDFLVDIKKLDLMFKLE